MSRSSVRVMLSQVQLCHVLDLYDALGGVSAGRRYSSCLQRLVEHIIITSLKQGLIPPVTAEDASQRLFKEKRGLDGERLILEEFNTLTEPTIPNKTLETIKSRIEDLMVDQERESNQELNELFQEKEE